MNLFTKLILIYFLYIVFYFIFFAFSYPTPDGDSLNYHIPIAKSYLNIKIINPQNIEGIPFLKYSPGASEGILSVLMFLKIPIQLFNVLGALFLFYSCFILAKRFLLEKDLSILFAISISSLPLILRWINMQIIDIWLAGFFTLTLLLLIKPEKNLRYYLVLGACTGMLIGTKFSGPLFAAVLFTGYFKNLIKFISFKRLVIFFIPFSIFGLFWYLRNFYYTGNPVYPQSLLFFKGTDFHILNTQVWEVSFLSREGVVKFFNAGISEYSLWFFSIFISILIIYQAFKKRKLSKPVKLSLIGLVNFIVFIFLPSDNYFHIFVSVFRYTLPAFIPIILAVFIYAKEKKKEDIIYLMTFVSLLASPIYEYHPKVLLVVFPLALFIYFKIPSTENTNKLK